MWTLLQDYDELGTVISMGLVEHMGVVEQMGLMVNGFGGAMGLVEQMVSMHPLLCSCK